MADEPAGLAPANLEREVKLGAWPGFEVPDLSGVVDGATVEAGDELALDATYFDTADLRLVRAGVTARHRVGDDPPWTVKLPDTGIDEDAVVRLELGYPGTLEAVPDEVAAVVRAFRRTAPLEPVARLKTTRRRLEVRDPDGAKLAEVDDDDVSVIDGERLLASFREVEVELPAGGDPAVLDAIVARLTEAGAGAPDKTSKVVRALGPRALAPPDLTVQQLPPDPRAGEVLRSAIAAAAVRIVEHDPVVRLDAGVEGVHQMRVGARRLRSDLRTFRPLLDGEWAGPLRDELAWLAGLLGPVRDADVLGERLAADGERLPEADRDGLAQLLGVLRRERDESLERAVRELGGERYGRLLDCLVEAAGAPALSELAAEPAVEVVPALAGKAWKRLAKAVKGLGKRPASEQLHEVRILAKRARYAADVAVPVAGKPARQLSKDLGKLQDALGAHQDAAVGEAWLRRAAGQLPPSAALVAGQLVAVRRAAADVAEAHWTGAWKASQKRATAWLPPSAR